MYLTLWKHTYKFRKRDTVLKCKKLTKCTQKEAEKREQAQYQRESRRLIKDSPLEKSAGPMPATGCPQIYSETRLIHIM